MELKIKTTAFNKFALTEKEREKVLIRILTFFSERIEIKDIEQKGGEYFRRYSVKCPCASDFCVYYYHSYRTFRCDKNGKIEDEEHQRTLWNLWQYYYVHLRYHIRMNGSDLHIKIFIKLLGTKISLAYLNLWAEKNMLVALKLKEIVRELNLSSDRFNKIRER